LPASCEDDCHESFHHSSFGVFPLVQLALDYHHHRVRERVRGRNGGCGGRFRSRRLCVVYDVS